VRGADALRDATLNLSVYDHRVDQRATVLRHDVIEDLDDTGFRLDRDHGRVRAKREHSP